MDSPFRCSAPGCDSEGSEVFRAEMFCAKHVPTHDSSALSPAPPPPPPPPPRSVQPVDKIAMFLPKAASATSSVKWIDYPSSLQELLSMPPRFSSLECFERFAVSEYSTENIFFWREIQQFKSRHHHPKLKAYWYTASAPTADDAELLIEPYFDEDRQLEMCSSARAIFCKYLIVDAQFEVNLPSPIYSRLCQSIGVSRKGDIDQILSSTELLPNLTVGVFDEAEQSIWHLMSTDSFRRFCESSHFLTLKAAIDSANTLSGVRRAAAEAESHARLLLEQADELERAEFAEAERRAELHAIEVRHREELAQDARRLRLKAQAQAEAERQRVEAAALAERLRVEAAAEAERQRIEAEAEAERQRIEAAAEAERQCIEAAAEAERQRIEAEAETERQRIETLAANERRRVALEQQRIEMEAAAVARFDFGERKPCAVEEAVVVSATGAGIGASGGSGIVNETSSSNNAVSAGRITAAENEAGVELASMSDEQRARFPDAPEFRHAIAGAWTLRSSGGCYPNAVSWRDNEQFRIRWPRSWFVDSNSGCALSTTDIFGAVPWEPIHFYVRLRRLPDQRHQRQPSYFSSSQFVDVFAAGGPLLSSALELQPSQPPVAVPLRRKHSRTVSGLPESFSAAGLQSPSAAINLGASAAGRRKLPAMGFMVVVGDEGFERKLFLRGDTNETEIVATSPLAARSMVAVDFTFDLRGALQRLMDEKQTEQRHGSDSPNAVINARSVSLLVIPYCLVPGQTGSFVLSVRTSQPDIFLSASAAKHDDDDVCVRSLATQYGSWAASANGGIDNCGGSMSEAPLTFLQNPQIIVRCPRRNLASRRDRLVITLRQDDSTAAASSSASVTHPIGFYLFHLPPVYVDLERARSDAAAANAARRAARLAELGGDEHELALEEEAAAAEAAAILTASSALPVSTSLESTAEDEESIFAAPKSPAARRRPIAPSLFPADDDEQTPTRLEGEETLQVLQDNELLLLAAEHRVQLEVAADFCAAAHPQWAERAAEAPEDEAYTASGQWALVEQFLLIPCTLEPTSFTSGGGGGAFHVDVALCQTARDHAEWTQAPPPHDLRVEFGVQTMLL